MRGTLSSGNMNILQWEVSIALVRNSMSLFQGCLFYKTSLNRVSKTKADSVSAHRKQERLMENCLPILVRVDYFGNTLM